MALSTSTATATPRHLVVDRRRFLGHGALAVVVAGGLILGPSIGFKTNDIHLIASTALYAIAVIGVNIVLGFAGQITLGPAATFAVGAYAGAVLSFKYHWNPFVAIIPGVLLALLVGLLIGMPALRLGGFYLAMVTAIAALAVPATIAIFHSVTGGDDGINSRQFSLGSKTLADPTVYRIIIVVTLLAALVAANLSRSAWGRWFRCLKVNEAGTAAVGVSVYRAKVVAFAISAAFGGLAGAFFAPFEVALSPSQFGFDLSTAFFVAVVIGGFGSAWGPILGVSLYWLAPHYLLPHGVIGLWGQLVFAAVIIVVVVLVPDGLASGLDQLARRIWRMARGEGSRPPVVELLADEPSDGRSATEHAAVATRTRAELPGLLARAVAQDRTRPALVARDVVVRFGGVVALDGAGLEVEAGRITALIGPNGSGKTTLLNVLSGLLTPDSGTVELAGADVTRSTPHHRAQAGLARTFQQPIVFTDLTGAENVMAGDLADRPSPIAVCFRLPSSRRHELGAARRAEALLRALGADHLVERSAAKSSIADSRILDLARALALDPLVLVLDEPAAGLGLDEIAMLEALVRATAEAGVAVLLVEHDVAFVARIADRVVALERGRVIADGSPAEVRAHPDVLRSYFGDLDVPAPSGEVEHA